MSFQSPIAIAALPVFDAEIPTGVAQAMLGLPEMLVIFGIVIVLFGATKLPQLGKGMGEALGNFKKAQRKSMEDEDRDEIDGTPSLHNKSDSVDTEFEKRPE